MNWQQLEDSFFRTAKRVIGRTLRENADETFYAVAIHESYRELDGPIAFPWLALNTLENLPQEDALGLKHNPPDWKWPDLDVTTQELERLWDQLQIEANRSTQAHWLRTEKRFVATIVRIVKRLYKEFKNHPRASDDFFCFFADEHGGLDLLKKCLPKKLLMHHFGEAFEAEAEREATVSSPVADRFERFRETLWDFDDELVAMGAEAIDFALGELAAENEPNTAARILGRIGIADSKVISVLRDEVLNSRRSAGSSAQALAMLGESDWLFAQTDSEETRANAIGGLVTRLRIGGNQGAEPVPLDYRPLEKILQKRCPKCDVIAAEELKPGSSYVDITKEDADEAVRGMQSEFVTIRQHAVCVAGERKLGAAAGKKLLPAIVERFGDEVPNVRRLAILALSYWKAAARPYHEEARKLIEDPDMDVRVYAFEYFGNTG